MREALVAGAMLVCLAASLAFGADGPPASLAGGASLCLLGALTLCRPCPPLPPAFWAGGALLAALLAREAAGGRLALAGPELGAMAGIAGAFAVGHAGGAETDRARRSMVVLTTGLALLCGLLFVLHAASPDTVWGRPKPYHQGRLTGTFLSANTAATMTAIALMVGLASTLHVSRGADGPAGALERLGRRGRLPALLVMLSATCLVLTASRAGIAAGALGAAALLVRDGLRGRGGRARLVWSGLALIGVLSLSSGAFQDRLAESGADDAGRLALWRASLAAWGEAPVLGHGLGGFTRALAPHVTAETASVLSVQGAAHALPVQWLVQTGLAGAALGAGVVLLLAWHLARGLRRRRRGRWVIRGALAALGVALLHGLVDYGLEVPAVTWWLALVLGLASGVAGGRTAPATERRASP